MNLFQVCLGFIQTLCTEFVIWDWIRFRIRYIRQTYYLEFPQILQNRSSALAMINFNERFLVYVLKLLSSLILIKLKKITNLSFSAQASSSLGKSEAVNSPICSSKIGCNNEQVCFRYLLPLANTVPCNCLGTWFAITVFSFKIGKMVKIFFTVSKNKLFSLILRDYETFKWKIAYETDQLVPVPQNR